MAKRRISISGSGVGVSEGGLSANVNPVNQSVGVGVQRGNVGVGVNSQGTVGVTNRANLAGDTSLGLNAGFNVPTMTPSGGATVTFDSNKPSAQLGGQIGGTLMATMPGGSLLGSALGSGLGSITGSRRAKEKQKRKGFMGALAEGLVDKGGYIVNPDGSTFEFGAGGGNRHSWKDASKRVNDGGGDELFQFETDYTNDLDYFGGMAGISLSRLLGGGKSKEIDQAGAALGNAALGSVGYGGNFTRENFDKVVTNARAMYAKKGIQTKDDMLALANRAYSEGRINDIDHGVMLQTADMIFDKNFSLASQLMAGRNKGLEAAAQTPSADGRTQDQITKGINADGSPHVNTAEESRAIAANFLAPYKDSLTPRAGSAAPSWLSQTVGGIGALAGIYRGANKITGGAISDLVKGGISALTSSGGDELAGIGSDMFGQPDVVDTMNLPDPTTDMTSGFEGTNSDYTFDSSLSDLNYDSVF